MRVDYRKGEFSVFSGGREFIALLGEIRNLLIEKFVKDSINIVVQENNIRDLVKETNDVGQLV